MRSLFLPLIFLFLTRRETVMDVEQKQLPSQQHYELKERRSLINSGFEQWLSVEICQFQILEFIHDPENICPLHCA